MKIVFLLPALVLTGFLLAGPYRPPNMDKKIFNPDKLEIHPVDRATLFTGLIFIARDFNEEDYEVDYDLRSNSLAIAGRLFPDSPIFTDVLGQLKESGRTIAEDNTEVSEAIRKIHKGISALMEEKSNKDNLKCASYCIDIALRLDPENGFADELKEFQKTAGEPDWDDMLGAPIIGDGGFFFDDRDDNEFKERSETVPGGKAEKFAAAQRAIYGLSVRELSNGRHAGAASSLSATALRDADVEGIEFHIDQKVGNMTGNSLEEVAKLMRVRHEEAGRMPSGYKVEIAFEDKDGLLDGPSAGTAMSIIIDSLFTGNELEEKFAVTGAITADGKVTPIGGVAGKIRGATRKGCNLVGVPHENIKGVSDILVLDGIEKLMNIQVFSFKTLDDALKVASKEKPEEVQQSIEDFNKVVELVKSQGEGSLKNATVIKLLEDLVEKMPNHESARILLSVAKGEEQKTLSLGGSFHQVRVNVAGLGRKLGPMMMTGKVSMNATEKEQADEALAELESVATKLDPRIEDWSKSMIKALKIYSEGRQDDEDDEEFVKRLKKEWDEAEARRRKLMEDPEIMEELMG